MLLLVIAYQILTAVFWLDFFLYMRRRFIDRSTRQLFKQRTLDKLFVVWAAPQFILTHSFIWRVFVGFLVVFAIYRLARDKYDDDDDDTHGKRLLSWGKSHLPKPYVRPIPVPV